MLHHFIPLKYNINTLERVLTTYRNTYIALK